MTTPRRPVLLPAAPDPTAITRPATVAASPTLAAIKARAEEDERTDPSRKPIKPRDESPEAALRETAKHAIDVLMFDAARGVPANPLELLRWTKVLQATGGDAPVDAEEELRHLSDRDLAMLEAILEKKPLPAPPPAWAVVFERARAAADQPSPALNLILRMIEAGLVPEFTQRVEFPGPLPPAAIREMGEVLAKHSTTWRWYASGAMPR